mmetsp:Transcript_6969/g.17799  ORF Transcript_6969/g.17799 Transcript_6969/m.17799 type:complete len:808 (+) Transcript_6969:330-2753(+)
MERVVEVRYSEPRNGREPRITPLGRIRVCGEPVKMKAVVDVRLEHRPDLEQAISSAVGSTRVQVEWEELVGPNDSNFAKLFRADAISKNKKIWLLGNSGAATLETVVEGGSRAHLLCTPDWTPKLAGNAQTSTMPAAPWIVSPVPPSLVMVGNSFLEEYEKRHKWAFGAFAELVQNANDARAKSFKIIYHRKGVSALPSHLVLEDDGVGMTADGMLSCMQVASNKNIKKQQDNSISGMYGVGFKQGVLRLGHTAVVISKSEKENNHVSLGVLSNQPYQISGGAPVQQFATLDLDGKDLKLPGRTQILKIEDDIKRTTGVKASSWLNIKIGRCAGVRSGTFIYIFGIEERIKEYETTQLMEFRDSEADILLSKSSAPYKLPESEENWRDIDIPLESSLREYLKVLFLKPSMEIHLLGKPIATISLLSELKSTEQISICTVKNEDGKDVPLHGTIGRSSWHQEKGISGAMIYSANCLIKAYQYKQAFFTVHDTRAKGVIMLIHNSKQAMVVDPNKQDFDARANYRGRDGVLEIASQKMDVYTFVDVEPTRSCDADVDSFIQCTQCTKWRLVTADYAEQHGKDGIKWHCEHHELVKQEATRNNLTFNVCKLKCDWARLQAKENIDRSVVSSKGKEVAIHNSFTPGTHIAVYEQVANVGQSSQRRADLMDDNNLVARVAVGPSQNRMLELKSADFSWYPETKLGEGRFANVFRGKWQDDDVAVKIFKDSISTKDFERSFRKERVAFEKLLNTAQNVVVYKGFCTEKKAIVMELIPGAKSLKDLLQRNLRQACSRGCASCWRWPLPWRACIQ